MSIIKSRRTFERGRDELPKGTASQWFARDAVNFVDEVVSELEVSASAAGINVGRGDPLARIEEALFLLVRESNPDETTELDADVARLDPDA